ncbi:MAG: hypothetical protein M3461_23345 [Pseudomonadota bacterium]|nr:hypothetical protein [Pseudomonadota bacterium]
MSLDDIRDVAAYLHDCGRFEALLARYQAALDDRSIWFEMVFAYWLEESGVRLEYERQVNPDNTTSVDFAASFDEVQYLMELVRIEHSDDVAAHIEGQVATKESTAFC